MIIILILTIIILGFSVLFISIRNFTSFPLRSQYNDVEYVPLRSLDDDHDTVTNGHIANEATN